MDLTTQLRRLNEQVGASCELRYDKKLRRWEVAIVHERPAGTYQKLSRVVLGVGRTGEDCLRDALERCYT